LFSFGRVELFIFLVHPVDPLVEPDRFTDPVNETFGLFISQIYLFLFRIFYLIGMI
jgi:hypothetical protein